MANQTMQLQIVGSMRGLWGQLPWVSVQLVYNGELGVARMEWLETNQIHHIECSDLELA